MQQPTEIIAALPDRLHRLVSGWAERTPDAPAASDGTRLWCYRDYAAAVDWARDRLRALGVRPGDRVMIVAENGLALIALVMAAGACDAWAVIVNARLSGREIDTIRDHARPRRVCYAVAESPDARRHAARHGADETAGPLGPLAVGGCLDAVPEPVSADGADQVAALIYTSGTTGRPKAVMLTHRNLLYVACVSGGLRGLAPADRVYGVLPISHVFGLASMFLGTIFAGGMLRLAARFDPAALLAALREEGVSVVQGVPAMYAALLQHLAARGEAAATAPALRYLSAGGSPLYPTLKAAVEQAFGVALHNGYGLTETSPTVSQTRVEPPPTDCSAGLLIPGVEARLLDPRGNEVPAGAVGELHVRGPNVMMGYYKAPEETAAVLDPAGWLNTRDLARFDDGRLWIEGRTRELIIRSGFNVFPAEVEAVLNAHPAVVQSAVVGRKTPDNEEVVAFVQLRPGADGSGLAIYAAERLAPYKRPAEIIPLAELPASSTGKVMKQRLAEMAVGRTSSTTQRAG